MQTRSTPKADLGDGDKQAEDAVVKDELIVREATADKGDNGSSRCLHDGAGHPGESAAFQRVGVEAVREEDKMSYVHIGYCILF
jgi:hypothetical protein